MRLISTDDAPSKIIDAWSQPPLPSLAEKRRIVGQVGEVMGLVDALEAEMGAARERGARLWEAVIAELTAA